MRFTFTRGKKKILLLSCDNGISARVSSLTSGIYDVESSSSAHSIIEDEHYEKYRILIADVDNDPDGAYNIVSKISDLSIAKNIFVILLTTEEDTYDVNSIVDIFDNVAILIKPIQTTDVYNAIQRISKIQNSHLIKNIRTLKDSSKYKLLRDTDTNLFTKTSFYNKFNVFLTSNKRRHMHLMLFGVDNLDIYNALYDDQKTQELMTFISKKLSSSIIFFASRFSFDKIALVVNCDEKTCQKLLTEIQINTDGFNSPYPIIIHAGICEIMPKEGNAEVLCNQALSSYIYAKYTDSDFVIKYSDDLKNKIWNGVASVYNTKLISPDKSDIDKSSDPINDVYISSDSYKTNEPKTQTSSVSYETPVHISSDTSHEIKDENKVVDEIEKTIEHKAQSYSSFSNSSNLDYEDEKEEAEEDNPFAFNGQLDLMTEEENKNEVDDSYYPQEESKEEAEEDNPFAFSGQLDLMTDIPDENDNSNQNAGNESSPFQTKEFDIISFDEVLANQPKQAEIAYDLNEEQEQEQEQEFNQYEETNDENEPVQENKFDFLTKPANQFVVQEEKQDNEVIEEKQNEEIPEEKTEIRKPYTPSSTFDKSKKSPLILEKEPVKEVVKPVSEQNQASNKVAEDDIKTYPDLDSFKNMCTKIMSVTYNHNPLFLIKTKSDYEDDVAYPELIKLIIYSVFNKKSHICNFEKNNYYVFLDGDYDDKKATRLAYELITKFSQSKYNDVICKIGIGISGAKAKFYQHINLFTLLAFKEVENGKESAVACKKSTNL